jgi:hypothetical protein
MPLFNIIMAVLQIAPLRKLTEIKKKTIKGGH